MSHNIYAQLMYQKFGHAPLQHIQYMVKLGIYNRLPTSIPKPNTPYPYVVFPRYPNISVTQTLHQKILIRSLVSIPTSSFQQDILWKMYLHPYHWWCHHKPALWISNNIEASNTTTHKDIRQIILPPWIQVIHIMCRGVWWSCPIGRFHGTLFGTWGHCHNHWWPCFFNKQEIETS